MSIGEKMVRLMLLLNLMVIITTVISMVIKHMNVDPILVSLLGNMSLMVIVTYVISLETSHKFSYYKRSPNAYRTSKVILLTRITTQTLPTLHVEGMITLLLII